MSSIRERLRSRPTAFQPSLAEAFAIRRWFEERPFATDAYLFHDGRIIEGRIYRRRCAMFKGYVGSLALIQTDGFPVNVCRRHFEHTL